MKGEDTMNELKDAILAKNIVDAISDGYDDEEYREESENELSAALAQLKEDSIIRVVLFKLCERVAELEG